MRASFITSAFVVLLAGCSGVEIPEGFGEGDAPSVGLTVTDEGGAPVEGARIRVSDGSLVNAGRPLPVMSSTDAEGHGRVWFPSPFGRLAEVHVDADGREPVTLALHVDSAPPTVVLGPGARLEGQVVDESGAPVAGADVIARPRDAAARRDGLWERAVKADDQGRFMIDGLPDEGAWLVVASEQLPPHALEVTPEQLGQPLSVTLEAGPSLEVQVQDEGGEPVEGAVVRLAAQRAADAFPPVLSAMTDELGIARLGRPTGVSELELTVDVDGVPSAPRPVTEAELGGPVVVVVTPARDLAGQVTSAGGEPLPGIVSVSGALVTADEQGRFAVEGTSMAPLENTTVDYAWAAGPRASGEVGPLLTEEVSLADGPTHVELQAPELLPVTIHARTPDGPARAVVVMLHPIDEEAQPLEGTPSSWDDPFAVGVTNDEGTLHLLLPEGGYSVMARPGGADPTHEIGEGVYRSVNADATTIDVELVPTATLAGTLVDETGTPLGFRQFKVTSDRFKDRAITNADGTFEIKGVLAGTVATLTVEGPSGEGEAFTARVEAGAPRTIRPGEAMDEPTGDVPEDPLVGSDLPDMDGGEDPMAMDPDMGESDPGMPDDPGMGEPGMDEPGMGEPGMGEPGMDEPGMGEPGMDEPGMGEPATGEPSVTDVPPEPMPEPAAPSAGMIEGSVVGADGAPVTKGVVQLGLSGDTAEPLEVAIDADGRFQAPDLTPGTWWVEANVPRHLSERVEVEVRAGEATPLVLDATAGSYVRLTDYPFASQPGDVELTLTSEGRAPITFTWSAPSAARSQIFGPVWPGKNEITVTAGGTTKRMEGTLNPARLVPLSWTSDRWR